MIERPYITLSAAMSLDGYLDSAHASRIALSNAADFDRVDEVRAQSDAILVGARTIRRDNPRLLVRSEERRLRRVLDGRTPCPWKVTVTASGDLDPDCAFFTAGDSPRLVYCPRSESRSLRDLLGELATVVPLGEEVRMSDLVGDLADRGVTRLMVEGGGTVLTEFLSSGLADELQLAIAPFFVGDGRAPRLVGDGAFPWTADHRATLAQTRQLGNIVMLRYALSARFGENPPTHAERREPRGLLLGAQ